MSANSGTGQAQSNMDSINVDGDEHANQAHSTRILHSGHLPKHWTNSPVMAPLYMTTTFETLEPGQADFEYSRFDNPTRAELERYLATLESAKYALAFGSGLASITATASLLKHGQHVLCCDDVYGGTNRFFNLCSPKNGIEATFVEGLVVQNWIDSFKPGKTKLVWIETPTNPTMKIMDIEKIAHEMKKLDPECLIVVDNTFMTPIFQSPLKLGADIVMHSVTKYINGHSDVIMGALMTNNEKLFNELKLMRNAIGVVSSPFDCLQVIRSIKTLYVRVVRQSSSAMEVAEYLEKHDKVERVLYPGLKSHPQYELGTRQCTGFSGVISIYIKNIKGDEAVKMVQAVKIFHAAVSLGCVDSLIQIPALMTHSAVAPSERDKLGITNNLLRLSIGLEDPKDLINDLNQAFDAAY